MKFAAISAVLCESGRPVPDGLKLAGAEPEHGVRDVAFENVCILGTSLTRNAPQASIGPHVGEVSFAGPAAKNQ